MRQKTVLILCLFAILGAAILSCIFCSTSEGFTAVPTPNQMAAVAGPQYEAIRAGLDPAIANLDAVMASNGGATPSETLRSGLPDALAQANLAPDAATAQTGAGERLVTGTINTPSLFDDSAIAAQVRKCEAITSCTGLETAPATCGVCLKDRVTMKGEYNGMGGGMFISEFDRAEAERLKVAPQPTLGRCAPGYFFVKGDACKRKAAQLDCERAPQLKPGCAQCYGRPRQFLYMGPNTALATVNVTLLGEGTGTLRVGSDSKAIQLTWGTPQRLVFDNVAELAPVTVTVTSPANRLLFLGEMTMADKNRRNNGAYYPRTIGLEKVLVQTAGSGQTPRFIGTYKGMAASLGLPATTAGVSDTTWWIWSPDNSTTLNASGALPVTLADPMYPEDNGVCATALVATSQGQAQLGTDPCMAEGVGPGRLSLDCVRTMMARAGFLTSGTLYPRSNADLARWNVSPPGPSGAQGRSIDDVAAEIGRIGYIAMTGTLPTGAPVPFATYVEAYKQARNDKTFSPCEMPTVDGKITAECAEKLWLGTDTKYRTYVAGGAPCMRTGRYAPGQPGATDHWRAQGGPAQVAAAMAALQQQARGVGLSPGQVRTQTNAIRDCYGADVYKEPATCPTA
jgi:hypothetical protein